MVCCHVRGPLALRYAYNVNDLAGIVCLQFDRFDLKPIDVTPNIGIDHLFKPLSSDIFWIKAIINSLWEMVFFYNSVNERPASGVGK